MNYDDADPLDEKQRSATERQLRRLVVPESTAHGPCRWLIVIHEPDLELLWGGQG